MIPRTLRRHRWVLIGLAVIPLVAQLDGSTFAVDGSVTVTVADYDIDDPSGGLASVGGDGELAVLSVFTR